MRETQLIGLPRAAIDFLKKNIQLVPDIVCKKCGEVCTTKWNQENYKDAKDVGMFEDGPMLHRYFLEEGITVVEEIQCSPWSSGPCIFLKLVNAKTTLTLFEWEDKDMDEYL
jgi:hypothetical protein